MTHSKSSSSSSSSTSTLTDRPDEEVTKYIDSDGNEIITTTTYITETIENIPPSPKLSLKSSPESSPKSSPKPSPEQSPIPSPEQITIPSPEQSPIPGPEQIMIIEGPYTSSISSSLHSSQNELILTNPYTSLQPDNELESGTVVVENVNVVTTSAHPPLKEEKEKKPKRSFLAPRRRWNLGLEDLGFPLLRMLIAEFLGSMMLILFCVGSANSRVLLDLDSNAPLYYIAIAIAFGLGIGGIIHIIGDVSGGHVNPAVSFALFLDARISLIKMLLYIIVQFIGGFVGAGLLWGLGNHDEITNSKYYGFTSYESSVINGAQAFFLEAFGTAFLILTILATINEARGHAPSFLQPLAIGFSILVIHIFLIPYTNCGINPMRGCVWNAVTGMGCDAKILVYLFGPLIGALAAVPLYNLVLIPRYKTD